MKKYLKKAVAMLGIACMLTSITACQQKFDAAGYVKSYADSNYKGEFDEYAEICKVDVSEAEKVYNENIENVVSGLTTGMELDEELQEKYTNLIKELLGKVKYTVEEDVEYKDDEFTVKVKTQRMNFVVDSEEATEYLQKAKEEYVEEHETIDQSEATEYLLEKAYEYVSKAVENVTYDEEETIELTVAKDSNGKYALSTTEIGEFTDALIIQQAN